MNKLNKQIINFFKLGFIFFFSLNLQAQCSFTQLGIDIDGEGADDESGISVSLSSDGLTMAVGAPYNDGLGTNTLNGHVRVYENVGGTWTQLGADIDAEATDDQCGFAVSLSGDGSTVAIGAPQNDDAAPNAGHVRVYKNVGGTWTQLGADIDGEAFVDFSGQAISLSSDGTTVAIGARSNDGAGTSSGHVRVYKNVGGTWVQQGADIDGEAAGDNSGGSVVLSSDGTIVAIGAFRNSGAATNAGHVRIFKFIGGAWIQQGSDIDGDAASNFSGRAVSLSSDGLTVAIGAVGTSSGRVRVYKNISGTWTQQGADLNGETSGDQFGSSVSLSSDGLILAVGAQFNDGGGTSSGHVRIFKNISGTWTQQGPDIDGEAAGDFSGRSVSLSSDGLTVAIGAPSNADGGAKSGHVRVFQLSCIDCDLSSALPTTAGTYTSSQSAADGSYLCFCDASNNLLLAIDTSGSGAVIPDNGVTLQIGAVTTTAWNDAGGIIGNPDGGAIFNRKWNVAPTVQPSNPVKVKYFFTDIEYDSISNRLLLVGTTIGAVQNLNMYKLTSNGFGDPHANGIMGTVLHNGPLASLTNWAYSASGTDHSAEFLVSSFSGGGGGFGGGGGALPVEWLNFTAQKLSQNEVILNWATATEINSSHFEIERSYDGTNFIKLGTTPSKGNSAKTSNYNYSDYTVNQSGYHSIVFYRIKQLDNNREASYTAVKSVNFEKERLSNSLKIYPNPVKDFIGINYTNIANQSAIFRIFNTQGKKVLEQNLTSSAEGEIAQKISISSLEAGVYQVSFLNRTQSIIVIK